MLRPIDPRALVVSGAIKRNQNQMLKQFVIVYLLCVSQFGSSDRGILCSHSQFTVENDFVREIGFVSIIFSVELFIAHAERRADFAHYLNMIWRLIKPRYLNYRRTLILHGILVAVGIIPVSCNSCGSLTSINVFSGWLGRSLTSS